MMVDDNDNDNDNNDNDNDNDDDNSGILTSIVNTLYAYDLSEKYVTHPSLVEECVRLVHLCMMQGTFVHTHIFIYIYIYSCT